MRNTDSFFKDDTVETRKITLTPNILRDDSSSTIRSTDAKESDIGGKLEKSVPPSERPKDDKKRKEKKSGMLSGLFKSKKKDKKGRIIDDDDDKDSLDTSRVSSPSVQELSPSDKSPSPGTPSRQSSKGKLQKAPPSTNSPSSQAKSPVEDSRAISASAGLEENATSAATTMRLVQSESEPGQMEDSPTNRQISVDSQGSDPYLNVASSKEKTGKLSPITNLIRPSEPRPEKVKKAKQRVELDDFDSSPDDHDTTNPFDDSNENLAPGRTPSVDSGENTTAEAKQSLDSFNGEAPTSSSIDSTDQRTPPLSNETSSEEDRPSPVSPISPITNPSSSLDDPRQPASTSSSTPTLTSPDPAYRPFVSPPATDINPARPTPLSTAAASMGAAAVAARASPASSRSATDTPPTPSTSPPHTGAWSGAALHAYMAGDNDIRDLLVVVGGDRSGVVPVSREHPLMKELYVAERKELREMEGKLDGLLGQWMERKGMLRGKRGLLGRV